MRPPIPEQIEDASTASGSDPLEEMSLQGNLLTLSPALFPWVLLEVRAEQVPPQARLRLSQSSESATSDGAWFEPGDSPAPGWMLVCIETDSATVMSPRGNLVQLSVASTSNRAAEPARAGP
jgi:hypothetical protein